MDRRSMLKMSGLGLASIGMASCTGSLPPVNAGDVRRVRRLEPVDAGWERVIRTTVGLRPYRPSGFLLRPERLGEKLLIHNYGHGGSGVTLSWGCAEEIVEIVNE